MLCFDQTEHENREAFIAELVAVGWTKAEAAAEWERLQREEEY